MTSKKILIAADSGIVVSHQSEDEEDNISAISDSDQIKDDSSRQNNVSSDLHSTSNDPLDKPILLNSSTPSNSFDIATMNMWSVHKTQKWLTAHGFEAFGVTLCGEHKIDGSVLLSMSEEDLLLPLLNLRVFGDVRRLSILLDDARREIGRNTSSPRVSRRHHPYDRGQRRKPRLDLHSPTAGITHSQQQQPKLQQSLLDASKALEKSPYLDSTPTQKRIEDRQRSSSRHSAGSDFPAEYDVSKRLNKSKDLKVDYKKMFAAMIYAQVVLWLTSYTMVVVHDRVPDVEKYPPLPDLVLDNVPYIPWAFQAVETIGISMMSCLICILIFHKHRTIIWRRCCALTGTVFLLRCVTMLITSLSVPGAHLKCDPSQYPETWMRLHRAFVIWSGFGMTLQGVRTCGDYMFSGHTTVITMLNMFITEYTPSRWYPLHTATWVANLFGVFFILAAHEHYSIDVFVAFYISSRLFLYYHSLANTSPIQKDRRTRIWFPLFSYFEENVDGDIPNEYEWPLSLGFFRNLLRRMTNKSTSRLDESEILKKHD